MISHAHFIANSTAVSEGIAVLVSSKLPQGLQPKKSSLYRWGSSPMKMNTQII